MMTHITIVSLSNTKGGNFNIALAGWNVTIDCRRTKLVLVPSILNPRGKKNHLDWKTEAGRTSILAVGPIEVVVVVGPIEVVVVVGSTVVVVVVGPMVVVTGVEVVTGVGGLVQTAPSAPSEHLELGG
jgi:hypothetical protein